MKHCKLVNYQLFSSQDDNLISAVFGVQHIYTSKTNQDGMN